MHIIYIVFIVISIICISYYILYMYTCFAVFPLWVSKVTHVRRVPPYSTPLSSLQAEPIHKRVAHGEKRREW